MSSDIDAFINRLIVLYGPPDSADDGAFIDEYKDMLSTFDPSLLKRTGDVIRDTHMSRAWPTPAFVKAAVSKVASRRLSRSEPPTVDEEFEFVGPEDERYVKALTEARADLPAYARMIESRGFIKVRKTPVGPKIDAVKGVVTDLTKRMTGERD